VRVLVTGANGFIGAHVVAALVAAGHDVRRAVRARRTTADAVAIDLARDVEPSAWRDRLCGIDAVVNCAGILREAAGATFQAVHVDAPLALFRACAEAGVRRVVQVSALGAAHDGEFIASKHRADAALAGLDLDWIVLRPTLVYSADDAWGGTSLLRALAVLPGVLLVPREGAHAIRPIAAEDVAGAIVAVLARASLRAELIELAGPQTLALRDYLLAWRRWFGLPPPRVLTTPAWLTRLAIAGGEALTRGPVCRVIANLLQRARIGADDAPERMQRLLGVPPRRLDQALRKRPSRPADLLEARWYWTRTMLLGALAVVWIGSGIAGLLLPLPAAAAALPGWPSTLVAALVPIASGADLLLGIALLGGRAQRSILWLMLASVAAYTLAIGVAAPRHWADPFGGLLKNVVIAALLGALLWLDRGRR
jgi:uncharacterized protein YbjT (DUF2867 family)